MLEWSSESRFRLRESGAGLQSSHQSQPPDARAEHVALFACNLLLPCQRNGNVLRGTNVARPGKTRG